MNLLPGGRHVHNCKLAFEIFVIATIALPGRQRRAALGTPSGSGALRILAREMVSVTSSGVTKSITSWSLVARRRSLFTRWIW